MNGYYPTRRMQAVHENIGRIYSRFGHGDPASWADVATLFEAIGDLTSRMVRADVGLEPYDEGAAVVGEQLQRWIEELRAATRPEPEPPEAA